MYNAMYSKSHSLLTCESTFGESRPLSSSGEVTSTRIVDGNYTQRKDIFIPHGVINFSYNTSSTKNFFNPSQNGKTFYNTCKTNGCNSRNGKSKRSNQVFSAPCSANALTEGPFQNGARATRNFNIKKKADFKDDSSDKSSSSDSKTGLKHDEYQNNGLHGAKIQQRNDKRNDANTYKRHLNNSYPRTPPHNGFRTRRMNSLMVNIPGPFPHNSIPPIQTAPDHFLLRAQFMVVKDIPDNLTCGSIWDKLSVRMWNMLLENQQTEEMYKRKMWLWKWLLVHIKVNYPKYGLYLVGSTMTGFGIDDSDVDMCLLIRHTEVDQRTEAMGYLSEIYHVLEEVEHIERLKLIQAKVPLLKFWDIKRCLHVDLNCNNSVGIRNTHLLYCYGQMDWRVRPLIVITKLWARHHNINDAKNMTISSYSLALMVIHFLQCGVTPEVLPCLQSLYKDKFDKTFDINSINLHDDLEPYESKNKQPLGELLLQFFQYYASFDFVQYAISVRLASVIPIEECRNYRSMKNDPHHWRFLCIEEPFDLTNTAKSVYNPDKFEHIRSLITASAHALMHTRQLDSIFKLNSLIS